MPSRSSAGALNWGHCKLKSTFNGSQVQHLSCLCKLCHFGRTASNDLLRNASAKGMEKDSDVAFYRIQPTVVLARNTHRNFTKRANFRSKIPRKIREERIFSQQIASTTTIGIAKIREFRLITHHYLCRILWKIGWSQTKIGIIWHQLFSSVCVWSLGALCLWSALIYIICNLVNQV